jgi:hypothetical protein
LQGMAEKISNWIAREIWKPFHRVIPRLQATASGDRATARLRRFFDV